MSVNLFSLQNVIEVKGQKVAVYVCRWNYPDQEVLSDATDIVEGYSTRADKVDRNSWVYPKYGSNRSILSLYCRFLRRAKKVMETHGEVSKAIFVYDTERSKWRGERTLYENRSMDELKADTPEFDGCKEIGKIVV